MTEQGHLPASRPASLPWGLVAWGALGICLHIGLARFGYGVVLPSLRHELDLQYTTGGVLNAIHLAAYLAGTLAANAIAARIGLARMARAGHWLAAVGALLCAVAPGEVVLGIGRFAAGLGAGVAVVAILVIVFAGVPDRVRATVSAVAWSGLAVAIIACGVATPWLLDPGMWRLAFVACCLVALLLAVGFPPRGATVAGMAVGVAIAFRVRDVATGRWCYLVATYFTFGVGYIAYATFSGTRLAAAGASPMIAAIAWTTLGLASAAGGMLAIPVLAHRKLRVVALPGAMLAAALGSVAAVADHWLAGLAGAVGVGIGMAAIPAIITAQARERSSAADYARAFSAATAALGAGQLIGPVVAGLLADRFGPEAAPLFAGVAYAVGAALAVEDARVMRRFG